MSPRAALAVDDARGNRASDDRELEMKFALGYYTFL